MANPFQDPDVTNITLASKDDGRSSGPAWAAGTTAAATPATGAWGASSSLPSWALPTAASPSAAADRNRKSQPSGDSNVADTSRSTSAREIELEKKERELKRKEEEVRKKEAELVASGALAPKRNWPGLCLRFLYHDIAAEVPAAQQRMVRFVYYSWFGLIAALGMNLLAGCFILGSDAKDKVGSWFLNLTYFVLGVPLSFWMWYWRLYNGVKSDRAFSYVGFFIGYLIHVAYCIWAAIAIPILAARWSFAGFVTMIKAFDVGQVYGFVFLVGAIVWTLEALWSLWCLRSVYLSFRGRGGPEAAKKEALKATISAATKV